MKIIQVTLTGNSVICLWLLSLKQRTKQCLSLMVNNSMFHKTTLRLDGLESIANPIIICNSSLG